MTGLPLAPLRSPLELPRRLEGILYRTGVAAGEIGYDHHVFRIPGRDAEGRGKLAQHIVAVVEIGADHHLGVVKLTRHQPTVVPPLSQPFSSGTADTRHSLREAGQIIDIHEPSIATFSGGR